MDDRDYILDTALKAALSGAAFGAPLGVAGKLWSGGKKMSDMLRAALVGGGLGAGVSGGTVLAGSAAMGEPGPGETNPYTARGGVGGALAGGGLGGLLGAIAAAGRWPKSLPAFIKRGLPESNIISQKISGLAGTPHGIKKGFGIGSASIGIPAAIYGADEGMGLDVIAREMEKERLKQRFLEQYG